MEFGYFCMLQQNIGPIPWVWKCEHNSDASNVSVVGDASNASDAGAPSDASVANGNSDASNVSGVTAGVARE